MTVTKLAALKTFSGELSLHGQALSVSVRIGIAASGALEFEFESIPLTDQSQFILLGWHNASREIVYFALTATAEDGTRFETANLRFSSLNTASDASGTRLAPTAKCAKAVIRYKLKESAAQPMLRMGSEGLRISGSCMKNADWAVSTCAVSIKSKIQ